MSESGFISFQLTGEAHIQQRPLRFQTLGHAGASETRPEAGCAWMDREGLKMVTRPCSMYSDSPAAPDPGHEGCLPATRPGMKHVCPHGQSTLEVTTPCREFRVPEMTLPRSATTTPPPITIVVRLRERERCGGLGRLSQGEAGCAEAAQISIVFLGQSRPSRSSQQ